MKHVMAIIAVFLVFDNMILAVMEIGEFQMSQSILFIIAFKFDCYIKHGFKAVRKFEYLGFEIK